MKLTHSGSRPNAGKAGSWRKLAFGLVGLMAANLGAAESRFSGIVVFGDSLSDRGRLYQLTHGGFPPRHAYFEGRQSNGQVWVEYLADSLGLEKRLKDYAVVGAMTGPTVEVATGNVWSDTFTGLDGTSLTGQLVRYLADTGGRVDPKALYIIEGGANDLIGGADLAGISRLVTNVATLAGTLKAMGAQHIAVVNVPDFGKAPRFVAYGPGFSGQVTWMVGLVNSYLDGALDGIDAWGGNKIARIDAFAFIDGVVAAPASFGFTNVTGAFMTLDLGNRQVTFAAAKQNMAKDWFFWDDLHPTTRGHKNFARNALATLRAAFPGAIPDSRDDD